jgi:hypothetical protein
MSISTTSGECSAAAATASVARLADDLDVAGRLEHRLEAGAHHRLVVGDHHAQMGHVTLSS